MTSVSKITQLKYMWKPVCKLGLLSASTAKLMRVRLKSTTEFFIVIFTTQIWNKPQHNLNNDARQQTRGKLKREMIWKFFYKEFSCLHKQEQNKIYTNGKNTTLIALNVLTVSGFSFTLWFVSNKGCTLAFHHLFFPIDYEEQGRVHTYTSEVIWL